MQFVQVMTGSAADLVSSLHIPDDKYYRDLQVDNLSDTTKSYRNIVKRPRFLSFNVDARRVLKIA